MLPRYHPTWITVFALLPLCPDPAKRDNDVGGKLAFR